MKIVVIVLSLFMATGFRASAQDTIKQKDIAQYIGKEVTFCWQVLDFDSRADCIYLYFGNRYPNQIFSVIVNRMNGNKKIKFKRDVMLGRQMIYLTGTIETFTADPDTTANYDTESIKNDIETPKPWTVGGIPVMGHMNYTPRTTPIDLKGKLVMIITDQKQIGRKLYYPKMSLF